MADNEVVKWIILFVAIALVVFLALHFVSRLIGTTLSLVLTGVLVVLIFTVVFGDGRAIVHSVSGLLNDEVGTQLEEGYEIYKSKEEKESYLDVDAINDKATNVFNDTVEKGKEFFSKDEDSKMPLPNFTS